MYVEYYHESEILYETLEAVSDIHVEVRNLGKGKETALRAIVSVTGEAMEQFHNHALQDPSIESLKLLEDGEFRRLYSMEAIPGTVNETAYETAVDSGGMYLQSRTGEDGWYTTMNYPDQESFQQYQRRISEEGIEIEPTVVRAGKYLISGGAFDLTNKQEVVLAEAVNAGYFEIPRQGSLAEVADELDISEQAASERLRRAMNALAQAAITDCFEDS
jgi:predicted DNA binding protein